MKHNEFIVAERPLASHAAVLTGGAMPEKPDLAAALGEAILRLKHTLAKELEALLANGGHTLDIGKIDTVAASSLNKLESRAYTHCVIGEPGQGQFLASIKTTDALIITDQAFGGNGDVAGPQPEILPAAAELSLRQLGDALGRAFTSVFDSQPLAFVRREDVLRKVIPASDSAQLHTIRCKVAVEDGAGWEVLLVLKEAETQALLRSSKGGNTMAKGPGDRRHPSATPFADIPLELAVPLAETQMPVSQLAALKVGDVIPLPRRSTASLELGGRAIARGEIGAEDGMLALRLTTLNWNRRITDHD